MKIPTILFILIFSVSIAFTRTVSQADKSIRRIKFIGNHTISNNALQKQIVSRKTPLILFSQKRKNIFKEQVLAKDVERLTNFYYTEGFLQVDIQAEHKPLRRKIDIHFFISEGQPTIVDEIAYVFMDSSILQLDREQLIANSKKLALLENKRFRDEWLLESQSQIHDMLIERGYAFAQVQTQFSLNSEKNKVRVQFKINSGPVCRFGEIRISGNDNIPDRIIKRQTKLHQEKFSDQEISKTQRQIYDLGVFRFVNVKTELDSSQKNTLPVDVLVKEAPRLTTKLGFGYGREDQFRTFAELQRIGLFLPTDRLLVRVKHSALEPYNIGIKWTKPAFLHIQDNFVINPFARKEKETAFNVDRLGAQVSYQRRISQYTSIALGHLFEQVTLNSQQTMESEINNDENLSLYNKSVSNIHLSFDNSTPAFSPQSGIFAGVLLEYSGRAFSSHFNYLKLAVEGRHYQHLGANFVLASRIKYGFINPLGESTTTPIEERFYAGGSNSIRGWARYQLGPKNNDGIAIGGNSLLETNFELRFPVYKQFSGVVFYDAGNVWRKAFTYALDEFESAIGLGARVRTPVGPIRVDFGYPTTQDGPVQIHLSIGQAF